MAFNLADLAHPHGKYAHLVKDHGKKPPVRPPKLNAVPKVKAKKPFMKEPPTSEIQDSGAQMPALEKAPLPKAKQVFSFPKYRG